MEHRSLTTQVLSGFPFLPYHIFVTAKCSNFNLGTIPIRNEVLKGGHTNNWKRPYEATKLSARHNLSHKRSSWELEFFSFHSHPYAGISRFTAVWFQTLSFDNIIIRLASRKLSKSQLFWRFIPSAHAKVPCPFHTDCEMTRHGTLMNFLRVISLHSTYCDPLSDFCPLVFSIPTKS